MKDRIKVNGMVTVQVFDCNGKLKRRSPGFFRRLLGLRGKFIVQEIHNVITRQGDAMIADALLAVPTKNKVTSSSGFIQVGTGWSGTDTKNNERCNTPTGLIKALDANFPALSASWGNAGDNILIYRATFTAGDLNMNDINEACLLNGNDTNANCLAYAQIEPSVNVAESDTLQILWEIRVIGQ